MILVELTKKQNQKPKSKTKRFVGKKKSLQLTPLGVSVVEQVPADTDSEQNPNYIKECLREAFLYKLHWKPGWQSSGD